MVVIDTRLFQVRILVAELAELEISLCDLPAALLGSFDHQVVYR
jgi:hypothetical protein